MLPCCMFSSQSSQYPSSPSFSSPCARSLLRPGRGVSAFNHLAPSPHCRVILLRMTALLFHRAKDEQTESKPPSAFSSTYKRLFSQLFSFDNHTNAWGVFFCALSRRSPTSSAYTHEPPQTLSSHALTSQFSVHPRGTPIPRATWKPDRCAPPESRAAARRAKLPPESPLLEAQAFASRWLLPGRTATRRILPKPFRAPARPPLPQSPSQTRPGSRAARCLRPARPRQCECRFRAVVAAPSSASRHTVQCPRATAQQWQKTSPASPASAHARCATDLFPVACAHGSREIPAAPGELRLAALRPAPEDLPSKYAREIRRCLSSANRRQHPRSGTAHKAAARSVRAYRGNEHPLPNPRSDISGAHLRPSPTRTAFPLGLGRRNKFSQKPG